MISMDSGTEHILEIFLGESNAEVVNVLPQGLALDGRIV